MTTPQNGVGWHGPGTDDVTLAVMAANAAAAVSATGSNTTAFAGSDAFLETYANEDALEFANITYDGNKVIVSADVIWPGGTAGVWTTTSASVLGYLVYTVTYLGTPTKTVTVQVTRNTNGQATNVTRSVA